MMRLARRLAVLSVILTHAAGGLAADPKPRYMDLFTDAERDQPYVEASASHAMPQTFVDGQWEGVIAASDGKTYFSFSCHSKEHNAQFYSYDPKADEVAHIIDVGTWCGQPDETLGKVNTQGKIHSTIYEADGKLWCSTTSAHASFDHPYEGGHFLAYDLKTGECIDLGLYPDKRGGLLTMLYEPVYKRLYAISQGDQALCYYDIASGEIVTVGSIEDNAHQCRVLISDRRGVVYGSTWGGMIYRYGPRDGSKGALITRIPHDPDAPQPSPDPERPLFGYDQNGKVVSRYDGQQLAWHSTHWVGILWDPKTEWWYGVRGNDEYLFRLRLPESAKDHRARVEGLAQIGFRPSKVQPRFASLGLTRIGRTLYYCSYPVWQPQAHLMSYNIDTRQVTDHGPIVDAAGRRVSEIHSLVAGSDGKLHAAAMVWSVEGKDPANKWADRAYCYYHSRFMVIDPQKDLKTPAADNGEDEADE